MHQLGRDDGSEWNVRVYHHYQVGVYTGLSTYSVAVT